MCKFGHRNCITVKVQEKSVAVKGQALFLVQVKGQGLFFILTKFDRGRSSEYRLYCGASPLKYLATPVTDTDTI